MTAALDTITRISTTTSRLMHRLGRVPPAEAEAHYYSEHVTDRPAGSQNPEGA